MQKTVNKLTQKERFAKELKKLAEDITPSDRAAFMEENPITPSNLSQYLNGKVFDNDKAALMIKYFKARIAKRDEVLH